MFDRILNTPLTLKSRYCNVCKSKEIIHKIENIFFHYLLHRQMNEILKFKFIKQQFYF